ncbi:AbrB family transcriptional regulator [Lacibacterium aquatile]|uniref:AbrB family transcriptional regulator n=1 Tax=Lacibacterium aquatile TaxID=1168082 RepID=A0ABW5DNN8_9PROT
MIFSVSASKPARVLLTLIIGAIGGVLAAWVQIPLPFMIGAMLLATVAALVGFPALLPNSLRSVFSPVIGVMLGSGFSPAIFSALGGWSISLLLLLPFIVLTTLVGTTAMKKISGTDSATSFFASVPGGMVEMVLIGSSLGGDERRLALLHMLRVLLVVLIIPFWFRWTAGYVSAGLAIDWSHWPPTGDLVILILCAVGGLPLGKYARLPAPHIVGPMFLSAGVHLSGLTQSAPPPVIVAIAQVVVGASIGARFAGSPVNMVIKAFRTALWSTPLMMVMALGAAWVISKLIGVPMSTALLAFAPGGLAEMSLIAVYLHADTAYVASHHIIRIILVVLMAPLGYRLYSAWRK